ncbi:MAG: substrate-binding domain-containing protein [Pseudonocardiaceae bacterium]
MTDTSQAQRTGKRRVWQSVTTSGASAIGVLVATIYQDPKTLWEWLLLIAGACLSGGIVVVVLPWLSDGLTRVWHWLRDHTAVKTVLTSALTLSLALAVGIGFVMLGRPIYYMFFGCDHPTELRVLSSRAGEEPAERLAGRYERSTAEDDYGCPAVNVYVYSADTKDTRRAIADDWSAEHLRDVGPHPDVWLADSTAEIEKIREMPDSAGAGSMIVHEDPIAWSPLVLGITASTVPDSLAALRRDASWSVLFQHAMDLGWDVVRPDPITSPMGEVGAAALYHSDGLVDPARARMIEQRIGRSLDQGGYPLGDGLDVLCRHRQLDTPSTAVIVSEQALVRFNEGDWLGGRCGTAEFPRGEDDRLLAFYPSDTRSLDHRFVRFTWSGSPQEREARAFGEWLARGEGEEALVEVGLRPPDLPLVEPLDERNGVLPGAGFNRDELRKDERDSTQQLYTSANRQARVLLHPGLFRLHGCLRGDGSGLPVHRGRSRRRPGVAAHG